MMYDTIVIGAGPAGLTAGIYLQRYKLSNVIVSKDIGGYAATAHRVDNFPGDPGISGFEMMMKWKKHYEDAGGQIKMEEVTGIEKTDSGFKVKTVNSEFEAKTVILSSGTKRRKLGVAGEDEFLGKGVSYCATCDGYFFKDKVVAVVGGKDSSASAACMLAQVAKKVYIIYRREQLRCDPHWLENIENNDKVEVLGNLTVEKINGDSKVSSVTLNDGRELEVDGVFIEIGSVPVGDIASNLGAEVDSQGYIVVDSGQQTKVPGLFAAGDLTSGSNQFRQIITAAAEGAVASESVFKYLK